MPRVTQIITIALLVFSSGCASIKEWKANGYKVGPNYQRPCVNAASDWIDGSDESVLIQQNQVADWWGVFGDPTLEHLIHSAYQQNLSLRVAGLRVLESREQRAIAALNLLPQVQTYSHQYARNKISSNTANAFPGGKNWFDDFRSGFDLSWELDVWGKVRRSIESSDAALDAEIESYDDILVTLIGDVAATYIELRSFDERLRLAEQNVEIQSGSLEIAEARQKEGRVSELDVEQAKSNLADTKALIPTLRQGRRLALNRLAILLGMTPYDLEPLLRQRGRLPDVPEEVVIGIPADLLRRRPDIRGAERQVAAQSAQIGIAEAELYPQLSLNGQIGLNADSVGDLFSAGSGTGLISPGVRWNILNYGRLKKNVRVNELRFQQAIGGYQNAVLAAHREVEDAIVQFLESKQRIVELRKSAESASKSVDLVRIQYKEGDVDFGRVFVVESSLVQRQDQLLATEAEVAIALVRAYKALGGGWQLRLNTPYRGFHETGLVAEAADQVSYESHPVIVDANDVLRTPDGDVEVDDSEVVDEYELDDNSNGNVELPAPPSQRLDPDEGADANPNSAADSTSETSTFFNRAMKLMDPDREFDDVIDPYEVENQGNDQ